VEGIARSCDLVLCLLPFEPPFYARHAVQAEFVGHPLADQVPLDTDRAAARRALQLPADATFVALLPGSRRGEVSRLAPDFIAAAARLAAERPSLRFLAPMANAAVRELFEGALEGGALAQGGGAGQLRVVDGQARLVLQAADAALVASGTASLEALLCNCPMVVAYRLSAVTAFLVRSLRLVRLPYFSLPNLLAGEALVPEFFQEQVSGVAMAAAVLRQLDDPARRQLLGARFRAIHASLRQGGAARAAAAVLRLIPGR
jgi:lipid-A-disaccharide synthase